MYFFSFQSILRYFFYILYLSMRQIELPFFAHKTITPINFGRK